MSYWTRNRERPSIPVIRKQIVGDSRAMERKVATLIKLVREDERSKLMQNLESLREQVTAEHDA